ncbi:MAG: hypothetical protein JST86_04710 [Bacteroidetes bacterium]|nr:hypothetical protein [Bacteroidota bacterium]
MSTVSNIRKNKKAAKTAAIIDSTVGNYEKHPFFIKKAKASKELINAVGLPKLPAKAK